MGSYGESQTVKTALENAYAGTGDGEGSMLVAAAGNNHKKVSIADPCKTYGLVPMPMFPGAYSWVIGVMAEDAGPCNGFSNWDFDGPVAFEGFNYEIQAKGVGIISCKPNGSYWIKSGTSMASPEVAGAVALMRQYNPDDSGEQIFAKLIQGSNSVLLDIYNSLTTSLVPNLYYIDYTIVDTLPGCDNDGIADAGETIQLYFTIKNAGGQADSVWTKIRFGEFEDTTTAIIVDRTSYIGSMSAYSTMTGVLDPLIIEIDPDVANNRNIVFEYEIGAKDLSSFTGELIITVQKGEEYSGVYENLVHLTPDKYYIMTGNTVFDSLIIDPGVILRINSDASILISGYLLANGTPDSMIIFTQNGTEYWRQIKRVAGMPMNFKYCIFEYGQGPYAASLIEGASIVDNCIFRYNYYGSIFWFENVISINNLFTDNNTNTGLHINTENIVENNLIINNNSFINYAPFVNPINITSSNDLVKVKNNVAFNNTQSSYGTIYSYGMSSDDWGIFHLSPNYFGTTDSTEIEKMIEDFFENSNKPIILGDSALVVPPSEVHGFTWKVEINNILINKYDNPYNSATGLGIIGAETLKFDLYFNRAMDTTYTPLLTFGVREPYTQHIVADSASWSSDSTIWTAYKTIDATTGDGIQRVRVASARDDEYFEIPNEDSRFEFVIQAAAAASIDFIAIPGIGKVELEWPPTPSADALGYNLYRSYNLTDSTYSDTLMINTELILDTVYTDYNVIPDTTYQYFYKTLGTDMVETDYSKKVTATPFDAANGDANGDLSVNVLDITTIVSYMLNQNPSPFLFDAADVNYDNEINVLDIIGLVQLINGGKSLSIKPLPEFSKQTAYYNIKDNVMRFESKGNVAALQLKLKVKSGKLKVDNLRIFSLENGFEFSYAIVGGEIIGILYSMSGKEIPEGISELFRFEGIDAGDIEIIEIFGGDLVGNYVPILKKGENAYIIANEAGLQVNPNPFSSFTQINYLVPENGIVNLRLFDLTGADIKSLTNSYHKSGNHTVIWDGTNSRGQLLKPGIYLLQIKVESVSGNNYNKEVKVVFTR